MPAWWGWAPSVFGTAFCFVLGAAIGSFLNVVAYRLPKGEGLFTPPSRCPRCETRLTWRENVPIVGWLLLRGTCRFCRSRVSIEYPLVEFVTAALFALLYAAWFGETAGHAWFGGALRPDWANAGIGRMWPHLLVVYALVGSLIAMTLIDARTFMIPLSIPWFATGVAFLVLPLHAAWMGGRWRGDWVIPTPETQTQTWAALAGMGGVLLYAVLLRFGLLTRSYADFEAWAAEAQRAQEGAGPPGAPAHSDDNQAALGPLLMRVFYFTAPAVSLMAVGFALGLRVGLPLELTLAGTLVGLGLGTVLRRFAPGAQDAGAAEPEWIRYPHARREAVKEFLPFAAVALAMALGWFVGSLLPEGRPPLWLGALAGASFGYLVGGGLVWLVRIGGSLAFGKEAMGMGDVHLLAAVGAALGWIDPVLAFFTAPFFGLTWVFAAALLARRKGVAMALPFGPHLAAGALAVLLAWPLYERLLAALLPASASSP